MQVRLVGRHHLLYNQDFHHIDIPVHLPVILLANTHRMDGHELGTLDWDSNTTKAVCTFHCQWQSNSEYRLWNYQKMRTSSIHRYSEWFVFFCSILIFWEENQEDPKKL